MGDSYWQTSVSFIKANLKEGDRIIAPIQFTREFPSAFSYTFAKPNETDSFQWVVIHKGMLERLDTILLKTVIETKIPVFANEVFVVFTSYDTHPPVHPNSVHMRSFWRQVAPDKILPENAFLYGLKKVGHKADHLKKAIFQWLQPKRTSAKLDEALSRLERLETNVKALEKTIRQQRNPIRQVKDIAAMVPSELVMSCRSACQTVYLGNGVLLCRILGRLLLYADANDIGIVPHLSLSGYWESGITLATVRTIQPGWYCLDVGANHGYFTLLMAEIVGESGQVLALEPNPRLVDLLSRSIESNGFKKRAAVIPKAASYEAGKILNLVIPKGQTGHAHVSAATNAGTTDDVVAVETTTIDALTADWPQVNFVKIDAEGAEEDIWNGMRQTIQRNRDIVIILEFGAGRYADPRAFLEAIEQEGFVLRYVDVSDVKSLTIDRCLTERPGRLWMLFLQRW